MGRFLGAVSILLITLSAVVASWKFPTSVSVLGEKNRQSVRLVSGKFLDIGSIPRGGRCEYKVRLRNESDKPAAIVRISVSCDCLSVEPESAIVPMGSELDLIVKVNLGHQPNFVGDLSLEVEGVVHDGKGFTSKATLHVRDS